MREITAGETACLRECLEALAEHHNQVSTHLKGAFPGRPHQETLERFSADLAAGRSRIAAVEKDGRVAGFCKADVQPECGKLDYLVVLEAYRGRGYGKALMDWAMEVFRRSGVRQVEVQVVDGNDAVHLYEQYGFRMKSHILSLRKGTGELL